MKRILLLLASFICSTATYAQTICDSVTILNVEYHPFYDSLATITTNTQTGTFIGYPAFTMFSQIGDTMAVEGNQMFGIMGLSTNIMKFRPGQPTTDKFSGHIGLLGYTGSVSPVDCFYSREFDLCPDTCRTIYPSISNWGGATATGILTWSILQNEKIVATGQWELTDQEQTDHDSLCLNPGSYELKVTGTLTGGGQWHVWLYSDNPVAGRPGVAYSLGEDFQEPFDFYKKCSLPTGIEYKTGRNKKAYRIYGYNNSISVTSTSGNEIGNIAVCDVAGRVIYSSFIAGAETTVNLPQVQSGIYIVRVCGTGGQAYSKIALGFQ